jgi:hypothetical protein
LSAINSAADSIKIISTDLWIFLIVLQWCTCSRFLMSLMRSNWK